MTGSVPSTLRPRLRRTARTIRDGWNQLGLQTQFYGQTVRSVGDAVVHYRAEVAVQVAQMSLGAGALAVVGGTIVIVAFLTMSAGALIAVQGYNTLAGVGVEALTGFTSAYLNVRIIGPLTTGIGLAATIGAGATAQLGAMRISEEIDALEVMGVRSISYLASTRLLAGVIVVVPLYCVAVLMSFVSARVGTTVVYGQSTGVLRPLLQDLPQPGGSGVVLRAGGGNGVGGHGHPHLLRVHRQRWSGGSRGGGRPRGSDLADRRRLRHLW